MELKNLVEQCHETAKEKGFWDKDRNVGELLMLVVSELGEAIEAHRKGRFTDFDMYNQLLKDGWEFKSLFETEIKDQFEDEICDTFIRLFDLCGGLGIDIEKHIELKMKYMEKNTKKENN
jgi:NTP pyrophosphatase (non-canonical NTP hydrolase)